MGRRTLPEYKVKLYCFDSVLAPRVLWDNKPQIIARMLKENMDKFFREIIMFMFVWIQTIKVNGSTNKTIIDGRNALPLRNRKMQNNG